MIFTWTADQRTKEGVVDTFLHNLRRLDRHTAITLGFYSYHVATPEAARRSLMKYSMPALRHMRGRLGRQFNGVEP